VLNNQPEISSLLPSFFLLRFYVYYSSIYSSSVPYFLPSSFSSSDQQNVIFRMRKNIAPTRGARHSPPRAALQMFALRCSRCDRHARNGASSQFLLSPARTPRNLRH
jgi:hypothetical protein